MKKCFSVYLSVHENFCFLQSKVGYLNLYCIYTVQDPLIKINTYTYFNCMPF